MSTKLSINIKTAVSNSCTYCYLSHIMRKPVFRVSNQVWLKPACSATEASKRHEIANIETRDITDIILSRQRATKALIRLHIGLTGFLMTWLISLSLSKCLDPKQLQKTISNQVHPNAVFIFINAPSLKNASSHFLWENYTKWLQDIERYGRHRNLYVAKY